MSKKCTINVKDEVWCFITGLTPIDLDYFLKKYSLFVEGYRWMPAFKLGRWDGKVQFMEKTGKTYVRLLDEIIPTLDQMDYEIDLIDNRKYHEPPEANVTENLFSHIELGGKPFKLRPYQVRDANLMIQAGSGFCIGGTGYGKTSLTAAISETYARAGHKVITIVPSSDLVDQTAEWYELLGMDTGIYSGETKDINHANVVATWQAIQYNPDIMQDFTVVIWDEAHGVKAQVGQKLLNEHGKHIAFRFGVTGTFPKPEIDQMSLKSSIGQIVTETPASWLIEHGYLSKVEIQPVELNEVYIDEEFPDYSSEKAFLSKSNARMEMIANVIISQCAARGNTLVLVNSVSFGEKLAKLIKGAVFLYGNSSKDLRKEHYAMFEEQDDLIVIATSGIASTGISIDRIFCLMLVDAGKGFIRAVQSIGRGLRKGHDKDSVYVVDIHSKLKWARKHANERKKWYQEAGYPVLKKQVLKVKE